MDTQQETSLRVLMFPWLAYGHISPFLELAKRLSTKNFHIYFCSTPVNLNSIKNRINSLSSIELIELHLPSSPELPPHYHTTNGLPPHLHTNLNKAFKLSIPNFCKIFDTLKPDLVIYDIYQPWVFELAFSRQIPAVHFHNSGAASSSLFYSMFKNKASGMDPSSTIFLRPSEIKKMIEAAPIDADAGEDPIFTCLEQSLGFALIKSCRDIEEKYINYLSLLTNKKMVPVGLLTQAFDDRKQEQKEEKTEDTQMMEWLNKKEKSSTVFVSFGSESFLSEKEREELAYGLELSNVNFIWVIRFPSGDEKIKIEDALPEGFLERVKGWGMVLEGWAPQTKILGHSSIGGFVSHCGWSSVTESLSLGVPIIGIPMNFDQPLNARLVVELGAGLEVLKDEDLEFDREEVARVIKEVVVEKSGDGIRRKAKELSEEIRVKEEEDMCGVVAELKKICNKNLGA